MVRIDSRKFTLVKRTYNFTELYSLFSSPHHYFTGLLNRVKQGSIPTSFLDKENVKLKRFSDNSREAKQIKNSDPH